MYAYTAGLGGGGGTRYVIDLEGAMYQLVGVHVKTTR